MTKNLKTRFSCKKSSSFGIFLLLSSIVILFVAIGLPLILNGSINTVQWIIIGLIVFPINVMFIWWWIATYYIIEHDILIAKWGPFFRKVPVMDISMIRLNQKTIGGTWKLALSWNSMEIKYKKNRSVFITPERQNDFVNLLKSINNNIEIKHRVTG